MVPVDEWNRCRPWIEAAIARSGFHEIEDIERLLEAGELVFWPGKRAAAITEFISYPNGKALNVFLGGGEENGSIEEFMTIFEPALSEFARVNGCRWIIGQGRPGWERACKPAGYKRAWTVLTKDLEI